MVIKCKTRYRNGRAFGFAIEWYFNKPAVQYPDVVLTRIGLYPPQRLYEGVEAKFLGYEKYTFAQPQSTKQEKE